MRSQDRQKGSAKPAKSGIEKSSTDEASPLASQGTGDASGVNVAESDDGKRMALKAEEKQLKDDIVEILLATGGPLEACGTKLTVAKLRELTLANAPSCWPRKKNGEPVNLSKIDALRAAHAALRTLGGEGGRGPVEGSGHARIPPADSMSSATAPASAPAPVLKLTEQAIFTLSMRNRAAEIVRRAVECSEHHWKGLPFTCATLFLGPSVCVPCLRTCDAPAPSDWFVLQ